MMSDRAADTSLRRVCRVDELPPGTHILAPVGPHGVVVVNAGGEYFAVTNRCPHAGAPLCGGVVTGTTDAREGYDREWVNEGCILRCPWHAWEFDLRSGETITEPRMRVKTWRVEVDDGEILVGSRPAGRTQKDDDGPS